MTKKKKRKKILYSTLWDIKLGEGIFHGYMITIFLFEGFLQVSELDLFSKCQNFLHKLDLNFGSNLRMYFPMIKTV